MKKTVYIIVALIIIAGGYYFYEAKKADKSVKNQQTEQPSVEPGSNLQPSGTEVVNKSQQNITPSTNPSPSMVSGEVTEGTFSSGDENGQAADVQVVEVVYDGVAFSPAAINIKANDWVFFKNNSSADFWPASSQHPTHTDYPEFDAKSPVAPGKSFKFQFEKVGSWKFHDHLNETAFGVVNVK